MKPKEVLITDGEWEIMESVWQADGQSPAEILARIDVGDRSHRTLRTLLARLVEKGAVEVGIDGSKRLYSANVSREECIRSVSESFAQRFFAGNLKSLLLHFVEDESLTRGEIEEIKQRLATLSSRSKSTSLKNRRKKGN